MRAVRRAGNRWNVEPLAGDPSFNVLAKALHAGSEVQQARERRERDFEIRRLDVTSAVDQVSLCAAGLVAVVLSGDIVLNDHDVVLTALAGMGRKPETKSVHPLAYRSGWTVEAPLQALIDLCRDAATAQSKNQALEAAQQIGGCPRRLHQPCRTRG